MEITVEPYTAELPDSESGVSWTKRNFGSHMTCRIIENAYLCASRNNDGTCSLTFGEDGKINKLEIVLRNSDVLALAEKIRAEFKVTHCPFCDNDARLTNTSVGCDRCGVKMEIHDSVPVEVLIEMWNRRANNE